MKRILPILIGLIVAQSFCLNAHAQGAYETVSAMETYVEDVADEFDISEYFLASLIYEESRFIVKDNLTQITNKKWFKEGFDYCESDDITNPYVNIRCCGYYLNKWAKEYEGEPALWCRMWNEGYENAIRDKEYVSGYAKRILERSEEWESQQKIPY